MIWAQPTGMLGGWVNVSTAWLIIATNITTAGTPEALPSASTQEPVFIPQEMIYELNQPVFT